MLVLLLNGIPQEKRDVILSDNDDALPMETNYQIRERELQYQVDIMRLQYTRQILKSQWNYQIMAVFESKINTYVTEPDPE